MVQSVNHRARIDVLTAWLNDRFGHTIEPNTPGKPLPDAAFNRDAEDLIKFLTMHGYHLQVPEKPTHAPWCEWINDGWFSNGCNGCVVLADREKALKGDPDEASE